MVNDDVVPGVPPEVVRPSVGGVVKAEFFGLLNFTRRPTLAVDRPTRPVTAAISLFGISLLLTVTIALPIVLVALAIYEPSTADDGSSGLLEDILLSVVLAPLLEEPAFRLWATARRRLVLLSGAFLAFWLLLAVVIAVDDGISPLTVIGVAAVAISLLAVVIGAVLGRGFEGGYNPRHFGGLVYIVALGFGFFHITNFEPALFDYRYSFVIPFLVVPQIMAGIVYMYVRLRLGFWAAVVVHGLENLALTLLTLVE